MKTHYSTSPCLVVRVDVSQCDENIWFVMYQQVRRAPSPSFFFFQGRAGVTGIYKLFLLWKHIFMRDAGRINEIVSSYLRLISLILKRSLMYDLKTKRAWWRDKAASLSCSSSILDKHIFLLVLQRCRILKKLDTFFSMFSQSAV